MTLPRRSDPTATLDWSAASIGQRVLKLRRDNGWSQRELAVRSGVTARTIARIETDPRASVHARSARRLACALNVTLAALLC